MTHKVKYTADGIAITTDIEGDSHEDAVKQLYERLIKKRDNGQMMSEKIIIFSEGGWPEHTITQTEE